MKVLVCGGRDFADRPFLYTILNAVHTSEPTRPITLIINGGAKGADQMASQWALEHGVPKVVEHAQWDQLGYKAGPIRNQKMLDEHKPDMVIAFPGGTGTADMVRRAKANNLIVMEVVATS
jgi:predicted Rossmann-fold nucleotide-binding protein